MIPKDSLTKSQWKCVHFDKKSQENKILLDGLLDLGYFVSSIDARTIDSEKGLLDAVSQGMRFPDYFGKNWDALDECLRDMAWLPAKGYVLIFEEADILWKSHSLIAGKLIESWLFCAEEWSKEKIPFHLIFLL